MNAPHRSSHPRAKGQVVLVLQGGGALGAYHIGAYAALAQQGFAPDWVCGISIGAINAAIIAGNAPADRVDCLAEFWDFISRPDFFGSFGGAAFGSSRIPPSCERCQRFRSRE